MQGKIDTLKNNKFVYYAIVDTFLCITPEFILIYIYLIKFLDIFVTYYN